MTPLTFAAFKHDDSLGLCLIEAKADITITDAWRRSALMWAAANDCKELTARLCLDGTESYINSVDDGGFTAVSLAASNSNSTALNKLILRRANVDKTDLQSDTPLMRVFDMDCTRILINARAAVNTKRSSDNYTALHRACEWGFTDVAQTLIKGSASLNPVTKAGLTPLMLAVVGCGGGGHIDTVKMLLAYKPDVNTKTTADRTVVMMSTSSKITKLLVDAGAKTVGELEHARKMKEKLDAMRELRERERERHFHHCMHGDCGHGHEFSIGMHEFMEHFEEAARGHRLHDHEESIGAIFSHIMGSGLGGMFHHGSDCDCCNDDDDDDY
jgi:ankyrin repeat protein